MVPSRSPHASRSAPASAWAARVRELLIIAALWLVIGLFNGSGRYLRLPHGPDRPRVSWREAAAPNLRRALVWAALTPIVLALVRRYPLETLREPGAAARHTCMFLLLPLVAAACEIGMEGVVAGRSVAVAWAFRYQVGLLTCATLFGAAFWLESYRRARASERVAAALRSELAAARLEALKVQLHPHFLFNTLNTIMPLISQDPDTATRTVAQLRELFRLGVASIGPLSSLGSEMEFLKRYLAIQETRFSDRLRVALFVEPEAMDAAVPSLILQPLVENAIRHGVARLDGPGRIEVRAGRRGSLLVLEVLDDGPGLNAPRSGEPSGLGLKNTRSRLAHLYGDAHLFHLVDRPGGGVSARIEIPWSRAEPRA